MIKSLTSTLVYVSQIVIDELTRLVKDSHILDQSDRKWPEPNKVGSQELEVSINGSYRLFSLSKLGSYQDVQNSKDPEGLT